jgi:hypothetical protein
MADGGDSLIARTRSSIAEIGRPVWERQANPERAPFNPFISYEFLSALEQSGSVGPGTGWRPAHLVLEAAGSVVAAAPLYVKSNSLGEYVFDHHWADAYSRSGGSYYPKLACAPPFSPVPGPRLLAAPGCRPALAVAMVDAAKAFGASSIHANFLEADDEAAFVGAGFSARRGVQFHWFNRNYARFDDFLAALVSRKRKAIRRERDAVAGSGLAIRALEGGDIEPRQWDAFWAFYQNTGSRKWGSPYLTREFFEIISSTMRDKLLLFVAERDGTPVAGALNFIGGDALYGRYWGCTEYEPFLHFELCYHRAVEFAIERGIGRVEAGAQGEHKLARGYEPVETRSAHWIADPSFRRAINAHLEIERAQTAAEIRAYSAETPYRKN